MQFVVSNDKFQVGVLSDLGSLTPHVIESYQNCHGLLLEANHDLQLLQQGSYPDSLKRRVAGDYGHLNNQQSADLLSQLLWPGLQHVLASHISDKNNQIEVRKKEAIRDSVSYQYALNFQQGLYQPREYYVPKYTSKKTTKPEERNDFRSTIYWNPNLQLNKKGKANIEFYAADNITTYRIIAEGFGNVAGEALMQQSTIVCSDAC